MDRVFFIDLEGKILENADYASHIGLAMFLVENNEELKKIFNTTDYSINKRYGLFLVNYIGYTLGYSNEYDQRLIINKEKATKSQKQTAFEFVQSGYSYQFNIDEETKKR